MCAIASPASDREAELHHQPVGERRAYPRLGARHGGQPGQQDGLAAAAHLDARSWRKLDHTTPIAPQNGTCRLRMASRRADNLGREHRPRRHDHRTGEQRVGGDRHHQQRLDLRPDHRAAGRERVGRRAGRRREHHAVTAPARQRAPVDLDDQVKHPLPGGLLYGRLVERPGRRELLAVDADRDIDRHPLLHRVLARGEAGHSRGQVLRLGLGQEADVAEIDPEQRDARRPGKLGRTQQRAVAAHRQDHLGADRGRRRDTAPPRPPQQSSSAASGSRTRTPMPPRGELRDQARARRGSPPDGPCARRAA